MECREALKPQSLSSKTSEPSDSKPGTPEAQRAKTP